MIGLGLLEAIPEADLLANEDPALREKLEAFRAQQTAAPIAEALDRPLRTEADVIDGVLKLAELLGRDPLPLNPDNGVAKTVKTVALIDEETCIGCTKCIQACPVDAIVGAASQMHTIIESHCTGCELCLPPCPVDCITMEPVADTVRTWRWPQPDTADAVQEAA